MVAKRNSRLLIITTVGTSLLAKYGKHRKLIDGLLRNVKPVPASFDPEDKVLFQYLMEDWKSMPPAESASAELNSLAVIYRREADRYERIELRFIATDTVASAFCAYLLVQYYQRFADRYPKIRLRDAGDPKRRAVVQGLSISDVYRFKTIGVQGLIDRLRQYAQLTVDPKQPRRRCIDPLLNFSGGYKALLPILTLYGQLEGIPIQYLYESGTEMIEIPQLPVQYDWSVVSELGLLLNKHFISGRGAADVGRNYPALLEELHRHALIARNEAGENYITPLGLVFQSFLKNESPVSSTRVVGHLIEYKLLEFYTNPKNRTISGITYSGVTRSVKVPLYPGGQSLCEVDLLLRNNSEGYVCIEVKPIAVFFNNEQFDKLLNQITRQVRAMRDSSLFNKPLRAFGVVFYQILQVIAVDERSTARANHIRAAITRISPETEVFVRLYSLHAFAEQASRSLYEQLITKKPGPEDLPFLTE